MSQGEGGGPKTRKGRKAVSMNAVRHGMRAKTLVLPGESQKDFERTVFHWTDLWEPEDYKEERLVETLIINDWMLQRAVRRLTEAELRACGPQGLLVPEWSAEAKADVDLMQRYKATAERAFYRALKALEDLKKDLAREKRERHWWEDRLSKKRAEVRKRRAEVARLQAGKARAAKPLAKPSSLPDPVKNPREWLSITMARERARKEKEERERLKE